MTNARRAPGLGRSSRYAVVAIILHWLIALAIVAQVSIAWRMGGKPTPQSFALIQLHKSIGISILAFSIVRLGWRLTNPPPKEPAGLATWERVLSQVVHWGFYVIMIGMPLTGWLMVSASKTAIPTVLFWSVPLANLPGIDRLTPAAKAMAHAIGENGHSLLAWGIYGLFVLHVGGALKHQVFDRSPPILPRMAPGAVAGRWWEPRLLLIALAVVGAVAFGKLVQPPRPAVAPGPDDAVSAAPFLPEAPVATATPAPAATTPSPKSATPAAGVAPPKSPPTGPVAWKVAPGSSLRFQTSWSGDAVQGRFDSWTADILFGPDALEKSRVTVTVDMTSARTGDEQRDASLPASDWFDAAAHPKAVFTATKFEKKGEGAYVAHGTLDLRGVKKPLDLPFKLKIVGDKAQVSAETSLDRTLFGVGQGEFTATDQVPAKVAVRAQLNAQTATASDKR